jgi:hypothetical protein
LGALLLLLLVVVIVGMQIVGEGIAVVAVAASHGDDLLFM